MLKLKINDVIVNDDDKMTGSNLSGMTYDDGVELDNNKETDNS